MKDLNFFGGKNCNNEDYVCHTEWPSASSLHAANLEIRWVLFYFTWEINLLIVLENGDYWDSYSSFPHDFLTVMSLLASSYAPWIQITKLVFLFNLFNSQKRRQTVMDVFMFLRMYEGKMMSVFSKKLKSLINYMNHWAHRFLLHLAYFMMRCGIYFLLSMLSSK